MAVLLDTPAGMENNRPLELPQEQATFLGRDGIAARLRNVAMSAPTLSVIMPNYNHGRYLAEAITGIATQSRLPDEFLILDDGSTDDSLQVVVPFVDRFRFIRVIRHERNLGVIVAHQRLFAEAQGDYVLAAAADDIRLPGFFERAMQMVDRFPEAGLVFGMVRMIDEEGGHLLMGEASRWREPLYADPQRFLHEYLLVERPSQSPCSGTIYRRSAIQEVGGYRAELGSWADTFAFSRHRPQVRCVLRAGRSGSVPRARRQLQSAE